MGDVIVPPATRHLFKLPARSSLSLRDQICEAVSSAITSEALSFDQPLPSCRELAAQLDVSRNTVFAAYNRLIDLGLLTSRDRSGYYVNVNAEPLKALPRNIESSARASDDMPTPMTFATSKLTPIDNPTDWSDYPYPFLYNQIDPNLFPVDAWRECSRQALGRKEMAFWTGDSVETDSPQLIQQLRQRLLGYRGIHARDDEILITLGAQNALFIVSLLFPRDGGPIAVEDPGFQGARNAFLLAGHDLVGVPVDREGIIASQIPANCQLVFTTPSHQFPTMVTMSQPRREAILTAAAEQDFMIIEDDYEAEMNFFAGPSPSLRSMDDRGRIIYMGSLSKTVSPGIRIGFIVAHRDIIREARVIRGAMLRHPPTIIQETAALFFRLGHFDAHLRKIERRFKRRWHTMRDAIVRHLGMLEFTENEGGTCFWLTGPPGFDATELAERLKPRGVLIDKGQTFHLANDNKRSFRVGFAFVPVDKLEEGVKLIAEEVRRLI
ncbi:MAG: GntR family transcriptional regulator/MocR family aminotransferase [Hyphomicrobiaceae bacterium]